MEKRFKVVQTLGAVQVYYYVWTKTAQDARDYVKMQHLCREPDKVISVVERSPKWYEYLFVNYFKQTGMNYIYIPIDFN